MDLNFEVNKIYNNVFLEEWCYSVALADTGLERGETGCLLLKGNEVLVEVRAKKRN